MGIKTTTLDFHEPIRVEGEIFKFPKGPYWHLLSLYHGLQNLYENTKRLNDQFSHGESVIGNAVFCFGGSPDSRQDQIIRLATNLYSWYAVSAIQYVRLVGTIAKLETDSAFDVQLYEDRVLPEVKYYRNKIAAHFAWTTNHRHDTRAHRELSILPLVVFDNGRLLAGGWEFRSVDDEGREITAKVPQWCMLEVHEKLRHRYGNIGPGNPGASEQD